MRNKGLISVLVLVIATLAFFCPVLLGLQTFIPTIASRYNLFGSFGYTGPSVNWSLDPLTFYLGQLPTGEFARHMFLDGEYAIWNPHVGCGSPVSLMSSSHNPLYMLLLLLSGSAFWNLFPIIRTILTGLFSYLFLREIKLSRPSCVLGAFSYMFSTYLLNWILIWHLNVEMLTPLLLYALMKMHNNERKRKFVLLWGVAVALSILGSNPQPTILSILFSTLFVAAIVPFSGRRISLAIKNYFLGILIGLILSAPYILDLVIQVKNGMFTHTENTGLQHIGWEGVIHILLTPFSFLDFSPFRDGTPYSSFAVVALMLTFFSLSRKNAHYNRISIFMILYASLFLFKLSGSPLVSWIGNLPIMNMINFTKYVGTLFFSVSTIAAIGLENIIGKRVSWLRILILPGLFSIIFIVLHVNEPGRLQYLISSGNPSWTQQITFLSDPMLYMYLFVDYLKAIPLLYIIFFVISCATSILMTLRGFRMGPFLLCFLCFFELFTASAKWRALSHDHRRQPPYVEFLKTKQQEGNLFRTYGVGFIMSPQSNTLEGLSDIRNLAAIYVKKYYEFIDSLIFDIDRSKLFLFYIGTPLVDVASNNFLDLLNVKYVLAKSYHRIQTGLHMKKVFVDHFTGIHVYENTDVMNRAFFVREAETAPNRRALFERMRLNDFNFRQTVILEEDPPLHYRPADEFSKSQVKMLRYTPNEISIETHNDSAAFLVLTDTFYEGWRAEIDSELTTIYVANGAFRAVFVPAGDHTIIFKYRPQWIAFGLSIQLGGVFMLVLLSLLPWRRGISEQ